MSTISTRSVPLAQFQGSEFPFQRVGFSPVFSPVGSVCDTQTQPICRSAIDHGSSGVVEQPASAFGGIEAMRLAAFSLCLAASQAHADDVSTKPITVERSFGSSVGFSLELAQVEDPLPPVEFQWDMDDYLAECAAEWYCENADADY